MIDTLILILFMATFGLGVSLAYGMGYTKARSLALQAAKDRRRKATFRE